MTVTPIKLTQVLAASSSDDPSPLKKTGQHAFVALKIVTTAAHAVMNTTLQPIPMVTTDDANINANLDTISGMLDKVKENLDTAKSTADSWLETNSGLNDRLSSLIPNHILDFSATYDAVTDEILDLLAQAKKPGADQADLVAQALDLVQGSLLDAIAGYQTEVKTASADLESYRKRVQIDHDNLSGSSNTIQQLIDIESGEVQQLTTEVQRLHDEISAYNRQLMDAEIGLGCSIFVGVVGVALCATGVGAVVGGAVIAVAVAGVATSAAMWGTLQAKINHDYSQISGDESAERQLNQQIRSLTALHMTVGNLVDQIVGAQTALSDVSTFWTTFQGTLDGLVTELQKPGATVSIINDRTDIKVANKKWQELKDFAEALVSVTTEVTVTPAQAA